MERIVLAFAAILEFLTGIAILTYPEMVIGLLFGSSVIGTGIIVSRIAGVSLIALGIACWPYTIVKKTFQGLIAMLTYNFMITIYLSYLGLFENMIGILLWPAVVLHSAILALLVLSPLRFKR